MRNSKQVVFLFLFYFLGLPSDIILAQPPKPAPPLACADKLPDLEKLYSGDLQSKRAVYAWNRFVNDRIPLQSTTYLSFNYPTLIGRGEIMKNPTLREMSGNVTLNIYRVADWDHLPKYRHADWLRGYDKRSFWDGTKNFSSDQLSDLKKVPRPKKVDAGLTRYDTTRNDIVYFHPTGQASGPYGLPILNCHAIPPEMGGRLLECEGRMRVEPDLLILYSYLSNALPCWASIEESIRNVVRFTKAAD